MSTLTSKLTTNILPSDRDIKTISFGQAARQRLGMYLSADPTEALALGLREIYVNSLDALTETKRKNGIIHIIIKTSERLIKVLDNGPGIPNNPREDKIPALVAAFTMPHTGSHFDGKEVNSIGLNGIGASVVTHTSKQFWVTSGDNSEICTAYFEATPQGALLKEFVPTISATDSYKGTIVEYIPDTEIYGDSWFDSETLINDLSEMMKFYPDIKLTLNFDGKVSVFKYPNGLKDSNTKMYYESKNLIIALGLGEGDIKPFGNRLYLPIGGAFNTHFKTQLTRIVNDLSGLKLTGTQIQTVFNGYIAIFVSNPNFTNQSKTSITNKEVNSEITIAVKKIFEEFAKTPEWAKTIKDLETELKAEQAAERARAKVKNAMDQITKGSKKKVIAANKLQDCVNHGENAWLAICEGTGAKGSLSLGRDVENVALMDIRGKFISCLKHSRDDFLTNEELIELCQILGGGIFEKYSARNLRYGKVLLAVDADEDGKNICDLLITFFYVVMPQFLKEGRLYWMKAPLYYNAEKHSYIFTEEEWSKVKTKKNYTRAKGLGEYSPEAIEEALFGKYKNWVQLKPANWNNFSQLINLLMGKEVPQRREFIFNNCDFEKIKFL